MKLEIEDRELTGWWERKRGRNCGECRLCCKLLRVEKWTEADGTGDYTSQEHSDEGKGVLAELVTPGGEWCPHACSRGCAIYETRPRECRGYECWWLSGHGAEEDRPDRLKAVINVEIQMGFPTVCIHQQYPGSFLARPEGRRVFRWLRKLMFIPIILISRPGKIGGRIVYFPDDPIPYLTKSLPGDTWTIDAPQEVIDRKLWQLEQRTGLKQMPEYDGCNDVPEAMMQLLQASLEK